MKISGTTRVFGLIGDPVDHSLFPVMQNAAFEVLDLDYVYAAFPVKDVEAAMKGVRGLGLRGINVTVPHKQAAMPYIDILDETARRIGAVNTIVSKEKKLMGYNTDAPAFMNALIRAAGDMKGRRVTVLGAGGAARAVVYELARAGANISILNRSVDRAEALAHEFGGQATGSLDDVPDVIGQTEVLVNATSMGLPHGVTESPVPKKLLRKGLVVYDLVYSAQSTPLTDIAREAGCIVIAGTEMLLENAMLVFKLFTGYDAPIEVMKCVLAKSLKR